MTKKYVWGNGKGPVTYISTYGNKYVGWPRESFMKNSFCIDLSGWGPGDEKGTFITSLCISPKSYRDKHPTRARAEVDYDKQKISFWTDYGGGDGVLIFKDSTLFVKVLDKVKAEGLVSKETFPKG